MSRRFTRLIVLAVLIASTPFLTAQATLVVGPDTLHSGVGRFGINLSGQNYYDSGQLSRNLVVRNPGFEAGTWRSILHCKAATATTCTDVNPYTVWPANFLQGASAETVTGDQATVVSSTAVDPPDGVTLMLAGLQHPLQPGDFLLVQISKPGAPEAGWWPSLSGSATISPETQDLSPHTSGHQALRVDASAAGASAAIKSYFDSVANHSFVQLRVPYQLHFRAKPLAGSPSIGVTLQRIGPTHTLTGFLNQNIALKPGWNDYDLTTSAVDISNPIGTVELAFNFASSAALLDDVSLTPYNSTASNPTAFRDEVVDALRTLHPGFIRYMDNGPSFGSSLDNLLADQFARQRSGYSTQQTLQDDIPIGLHDFLQLCETVGADPWFTMPPGLSSAEAANLIQYLAGATTTPYGARRAALGHPVPWTKSFNTIHLELGNEQWNNGSFSGATLNDPIVYGTRAASIFGAMRSNADFVPAQFDLIMGTWSAVPWYTQQELIANPKTADTVAIAPYLFSTFNDASSTEAIFGPMFAEPQQWDSHASGQVAQQHAAAQGVAKPPRLGVYEVNLGTAQGSVAQSAIDSTVPSLGGALAVAEHMLLMLRDAGVSEQALFALPEYANSFAGGKTTPLWGSVVDMGGATNLRRPTYLALEAINQAILPTLLTTHLTGGPTWKQPASSNDSIPASTAQTLETFAFADGTKRSLILINLSRTKAEPLRFSGPNAPTGQVQRTVLTAGKITANNETSEKVSLAATTDSSLPTSTTLPPYSLTVLTWTVK